MPLLSQSTCVPGTEHNREAFSDLGQNRHPEPVLAASGKDEMNVELTGSGKPSYHCAGLPNFRRRNKFAVFKRSFKKHLLPNTCFAVCASISGVLKAGASFHRRVSF